LDLDQLAFLEATLEQKIKLENLYGNQQCQAIAHGVGKAVANLVDSVMAKQIN